LFSIVFHCFSLFSIVFHCFPLFCTVFLTLCCSLWSNQNLFKGPKKVCDFRAASGSTTNSSISCAANIGCVDFRRGFHDGSQGKTFFYIGILYTE
jgi:hypothetical protein